MATQASRLNDGYKPGLNDGYTSSGLNDGYKHLASTMATSFGLNDGYKQRPLRWLQAAASSSERV
jgi:hypothetical protein